MDCFTLTGLDRHLQGEVYGWNLRGADYAKMGAILEGKQTRLEILGAIEAGLDIFIVFI
ncbi:MAG: hypothetical protein WAW02_06885 [Sideroxyarcus sp.]